MAIITWGDVIGCVEVDGRLIWNLACDVVSMPIDAITSCISAFFSKAFSSTTLKYPEASTLANSAHMSSLVAFAVFNCWARCLVLRWLQSNQRRRKQWPVGLQWSTHLLLYPRSSIASIASIASHQWTCSPSSKAARAHLQRIVLSRSHSSRCWLTTYRRRQSFTRPSTIPSSGVGRGEWTI